MVRANLATVHSSSDTAESVLTFKRFNHAYEAVSEYQWQKPVVSRVCELLALRDNWDSYHAPALGHDLGMFAIQLLEEVMVPGIKAPQIVPTSEGKLQIEWHTGGCDLEIEINGIYDIDMWFQNHKLQEDAYFVSLDSDYTEISNAIRTIIRQKK